MLKPICSCDKHLADGEAPVGPTPGPRAVDGPGADVPAASPVDDAFAPGNGVALVPST
ncbi:hypothetical protein PV318_09470 [Streptomyces sp. ME02-6991-2B]|nr:hypothetical protein [Streptomyces sp. ME19-03-3]MDX3215745.1 hypothetical protein [Streptomyces sp. ME02-6991-2B]